MINALLQGRAQYLQRKYRAASGARCGLVDWRMERWKAVSSHKSGRPHFLHTGSGATYRDSMRRPSTEDLQLASYADALSYPVQ